MISCPMAQKTGMSTSKDEQQVVKGNLVRVYLKDIQADHLFVHVRKVNKHQVHLARRLRKEILRTSEMLHMDLFDLFSVEDEHMICFMIDCGCLENRLRHKSKTIRCDMEQSSRINFMMSFVPRKESRENLALPRLHSKCVAERKNSSAYASRESTAAKEVKLSSEDQALHDELCRVEPEFEAIRLFLAFASFMASLSTLMDVKSAILYGNLTEERYVKQPQSFEDSCASKQGYEMSKGTLNGLHQAPRACQDKYVKDILNKFDFRTIKPASTPIEAHKSLGKDEEGEDVDISSHSKGFSSTCCQKIFRFVQLFLNKQLEGVDRPQDFIPSVSLPSKVFTFMRKHSTKFSCRITPLTPSMLEVVSALAAEEEQSTSPHSRAASSARVAQGTPTQSAAHSQRTASVQGTASFQGTATSQGTAEIQRTADFQGTAEPHDAASIPKSPNDYTPTDASQTSGGDEGLLDIYALNREVRRLKKQTLSQAKQIITLKAKLKKLSKFVQPVVKHHALWVENQNLKKQKRRRKKHKKKVSSVKLGRNKDEGTLSEEHNVQEEDTTHPFFDDIADQDAAVTPDLERKSDGTEEVNIEEKEASNVKSGETIRNWILATNSKVLLDKPRGLSIPGPIQTQPQQPTQGTDPKDKGKGILNIQADGREEERKRFEELKKTKPKTTLRKPTSLAQERNQMMSFLKGQGYKNLQKLKYPQMKELYDKVQASIKDSFKDFIPMDSEKEREMLKERDAKRLLRKRKATISEEQPSKKPKLRTETIDELRNYLRVVDFEKSVHDKESLEGISMITELQVIDSPDGEQDLYHLYRVVDDYYEHIPPTGLGLTLLGDLNIIWETAESSDDDFWKDQEEWEIIRWRFHESSGVHTLEIEDGTMIHMLAERRYPLSREAS
ncbi:putative ribonuclease H-like domain-containing protein [Tanacetum coccineum]|uniref:Ribonuclease H-like domain-containing protein n=1 Tax=Tanacetum coccineum TaxID=301880 RepID=A0ABQ4XGF4_9ASTR